VEVEGGMDGGGEVAPTVGQPDTNTSTTAARTTNVPVRRLSRRQPTDRARRRFAPGQIGYGPDPSGPPGPGFDIGDSRKDSR